MARKPVWAVAMTTCAQRVRDQFTHRTLESLRGGGWDDVHVFADGMTHSDADALSREVGHEVTSHRTPLRTFGNWITALWGVYVLRPDADRFAVFQDDFQCVKNLRSYLDACPYPDRGYLNLFTFRENCALTALATGSDPLVPRNDGGWCDGWRVGWFRASQKGRGAVGLVFDRDAVVALLSSAHIAERPQDAMRGHRAVDGGIVTALAKAGISEWCHWPSPLRHTGVVSSMGNSSHRNAESFPGEDFDALDFLEGRG